MNVTLPSKNSWWQRLKKGLKSSSDRLGDGLKTIFQGQRIDEKTLEELEELLISSDLGVKTAQDFTAALKQKYSDKDVSLPLIKSFLANEIEQILTSVAYPLEPKPAFNPHVILVVGVNGSGKTTTIAKLAKQWQDQNYTVHMAAGDTFRAAAVEQLQIWGNRLKIPVTAASMGADAGGLAYDALSLAQQGNADILLIDTAGRLHNKIDLMNELKKVIRVLKKLDPAAPHDVILVLDGTIGQNAYRQVQLFQEMVGVTGLILTKLDGTARGGVVVGLAEHFKLPVHAIGMGEGEEDLQPFRAHDFAAHLLGLAES